MVPVVSYRLGPEDFGVFGVVMASVAFVSTAATMGSGYIMAAHFPNLEVEARRELVSSLFFAGFSLALATALIVMGFWALQPGDGNAFAAIPLRYVLAGLAATLASVPWLLAVEVTVLEGAANRYGWVVAAQAVITAGVTVVCLYVLDFGVGALFAGALGGSLAALAGAAISVRGLLRPRISRKWLREMVRNGVPASFSTAAENVYSLVERVTVAKHVGLAGVGLIAHSAQYRTLVQVGVKAGARAVWPVSLEEARGGQGFPRTKAVWDYMYVAVTVAGLFFANLGAVVVSALTHGKFIAAAPLVPLWMIFILLQNSGKPQTATLWGSGLGPRYARIVAVASLVAAALVLPSVMLFGLWGPLYVAIAQQAFVRLAIRFELRARAFDFVDQWAVGGSLAIGAAMLVADRLDGDMTLRASILAIEVLIVAVAADLTIPDFGRSFLRLPRRRPG